MCASAIPQHFGASKAASFDGQFALLVARHLYFLFFVIIVLLHLAHNILCSVRNQSRWQQSLYYQISNGSSHKVSPSGPSNESEVDKNGDF